MNPVTPEPGNWRIGFFLALVTATAWGMLPIALKAMLNYMDPFTITWFRFLAAALITGGVLSLTGGLPKLHRLGARTLGVLLVAAAGLIGNYLLYLLGLSFASPGATQILIQLAPLFLLLGGVLIFRESFSPLQWIGFVALLCGLTLFFHDRLAVLADLDSDLSRGVILIVLASLVWAAYAIAQKLLHGHMTSQGVLLVIYVAASISLFPAAVPESVFELSPWALTLLAFCSVNTLVAYGCFAEAMRHWQASRVSAVLAVTPLLTVGFGWLLATLPTGYVNPDKVDALSLAGAVIVVSGSAICALGGGRRRALS
jgi:drug/metabolite transporter (DMT)-like permease